ncbi:Flp family type IVb pilin [Pseudorhizobium halotolerans]|uniref:Flp family type IVb pilin n=1 Tax=Pseudorhizobium halotolerans TaxID=1233081 RepID=A0ABN7JCF4_9HYPH|nr:Flp family type IVb pilin [Pseudorhizobium halotolerans]CAD7022826.1 Flp family type IVb pilin [Pseudorhizobium halotolerans]
MRLLNAFSGSKDGATAVEYGLIAALIAVGLVAAFGGFADTLVGVFETIEGYLTNAVN